MTNRKSVMAFSAILIIVFHLGVDIFAGNGLENFIRQTAFVGVDMFFFLSGLSLGQRPLTDIRAFLGNRLVNVYLKFFVFALIALFYKGWELQRFVMTITGVELFTKGGGAFLWFLPAIMILYLIYPIYDRGYEKNSKAAITGTVVLWVAIAVVVTIFTDYKALFIFFNRLPVFFLAFYLGKNNVMDRLNDDRRLKLATGGILTMAGAILMYNFGFMNKLQTPVYNSFYILALPMALGLCILVSFVPENRLIRLIGSATLEIYAVQMVFGYRITNWIYMTTKQPLLTNVLAIVIVIAIGCGFNRIFTMIIRRFFRGFSLKV